MFIGREYEKKKIQKFIKENKKALLIYGKRRVGKTELIKQSLINDDFIYYECSKDTLLNNISHFINSIAKKVSLPQDFEASSFSTVFSLLNMMNRKLIIVIDEYPYLYEYEDEKKVDSQFQDIIDNSLINLKLIICGSNVAVMNSLLEEGNALFGRFDEYINLKELNYKEAQNFYNNESIYNKIAYYSVFGGSPYINIKIDKNLDLKENIINNFLDKDSSCFKYCDNLLFTDVPSSININALCTILKNGKKTCSEIENHLKTEKNGGMNKKLDLLTKMGLIKKYQPINKIGNFKSTRYELNDNAIRFFYSFIYQNISILEVIGPYRFYDEYIKDKLITFISHRFEEIVRDYFSISVKEGYYKDIINIGTYYYDDLLKKESGEFDVALQLKNNKYKIVEVKYYKDKIFSIKDMKYENEQIKRINEINVDSVAFISTSGYENNSSFETIDINDLYK